MIEIMGDNDFEGWDFQMLAVDEGDNEIYINQQLYAQMMGWTE